MDDDFAAVERGGVFFPFTSSNRKFALRWKTNKFSIVIQSWRLVSYSVHSFDSLWRFFYCDYKRFKFFLNVFFGLFLSFEVYFNFEWKTSASPISWRLVCNSKHVRVPINVIHLKRYRYPWGHNGPPRKNKMGDPSFFILRFFWWRNRAKKIVFFPFFTILLSIIFMSSWGMLDNYIHLSLETWMGYFS